MTDKCPSPALEARVYMLFGFFSIAALAYLPGSIGIFIRYLNGRKNIWHRQRWHIRAYTRRICGKPAIALVRRLPILCSRIIRQLGNRHYIWRCTILHPQKLTKLNKAIVCWFSAFRKFFLQFVYCVRDSTGSIVMPLKNLVSSAYCQPIYSSIKARCDWVYVGAVLCVR